MEDNLAATDTFSPTIFEQAASYAKESGINLTPETEKSAIEIDEETSKILVQVPFDIAANLTKCNDIILQDNEIEKLGKLWRGPLQRLLGQYKDSDIIIAAVATMGIAMEKYVHYEHTVKRRNRTGDAGEGQDQLREGKAS